MMFYPKKLIGDLAMSCKSTHFEVYEIVLICDPEPDNGYEGFLLYMCLNSVLGMLDMLFWPSRRCLR